MKHFLQKSLSVYEKVRNRLYTRFYRTVYPEAEGLRVLGPIRISPPNRLVLGKNITLNEGVYINSRDTVTIGDNTHLSSFVIINTGNLNIDESNTRAHLSGPVVIGNNVWIASNVIINSGVTIGDGVTVGAGAVVTRDLPPHTLCVGVPARPVRKTSA